MPYSALHLQRYIITERDREEERERGETEDCTEFKV